MNRWLLGLLGAAILVGLFFLLRPGSEEPAPTATGTPTPEVTSTGTPEPTPPEETPDPTPTATPSLDAVEVEVEEGRVEGPARITVAQGDRVAIEVEADTTDHVHVHGYDLLFDTSPGEKVLIRFRADIPGIFEIELEEAGLLLTQLEVTA
jgi:hypothetical protein